MAAHFYIHDGDSWVEITDRVNLTNPPQLRENAEEGSVAMSTIIIDDPDMDLEIEPWMRFVATEDESESDDKVWAAGRLASRTVQRYANGNMDPFGRFWSAELVDCNERWHRRIFKASDANRDEETDNQRVEWVLEQMQDWGLVDDITTYVTAGADSPDLDAEDFRGRYPDDVMGQTSEIRSKNWWIQRQGDVGGDLEDFAWWGSSGNSVYTSPLYLTNDNAVLSEWIGGMRLGTSSVWPLIRDHGLRCSPDRMYSGAYARHRSGAIYRVDSGTADVIGRRDVVMAGTDQLTKARAINRAERYLDEFDVEDYRVTARLRLPAGKVTQLRAGMRVRVSMTHWPFGLDDWQFWRVMAVSVSPAPAGPWYDLDVELASTGDSASGPGTSGETSGGVIRGAFGGDNYDGTGYHFSYAGTGDAPPSGYPVAPLLDTDRFAYYSNAEGYIGFEVLEEVSSIDVILYVGFITTMDNQTGTAEAEIRLNGVQIAYESDMFTAVGVSGWNPVLTVETTLTDLSPGDIITAYQDMDFTGTDRQWLVARPDHEDRLQLLPGIIP